MYIIRNSEYKDKDSIIRFIDTYWKKDHALVKSSSLFNFQHLESDGTLSFIVAVNNETNDIDGLFGYISISHFDSLIKDNGLFWGAIWKIRTDITNTELNRIGLKMLYKIMNLPNFKTYAAIGISSIAKDIYTLLKFNMGHLNHYYILNENISNFNIAQNVEPKQVREHTFRDYFVRTIDITDYENSTLTSDYYPCKTINYLINRYKNHPIYEYDFLGLFIENELSTIFVLRKIFIGSSSIIRIIDVYGKIHQVPDLYNDFQNILDNSKSEYIDLLNYGLDIDYVNNIGFELLDFESNIIIPTYFEPFLRENVKIEFAYKGVDDYLIFKGDSDQDRPNVIYL